jgi:hypothetical protein
VLLALGASPANGATHRAQSAAAPGCCFKLSIYDDETVAANYNVMESYTVNQFRPTILGHWLYAVTGTAYGLALLKPWGLLSLYGGVAAGSRGEENTVDYHPAEGVSEPFGCTQGFGGENDQGFGMPFERVQKPNPEYVAPANGGSGDFVFGEPYEGWKSECPTQFSAAETQMRRVLAPECSNKQLLENPSDLSGGPICDSKLNPYRALSGEHKVNKVDIKCTEQVSAEKEGYSLEARVAIVVIVVRVNSKERKQQERTLRKFIGKQPPKPNPAERATSGLGMPPPGSGKLLCSSSS